eukprot:278590-Prymnesium_polylepis.1
MNGMNAAQVAEIYRQGLLQQGVAALDFTPNAGMLLWNKPRDSNPPGRRVFTAVGIDQVQQYREVDWVVRCFSEQASDTAMQAFDRNARSGGVHLGLITEDTKILKWFTVPMAAIPPRHEMNDTSQNNMESE